MLGALYLAECALLVPPGAIVFASWFGLRFKRASPARLALANPLPPLGTAHLVSGIPFAVSPEGACAAGRTVHFESMKDVVSRERDVVVDSARFVRCASEASARRWRALLVELKEAKPKARAKIIDRAIAEAMDVEAIAADRKKLAAWMWPMRLSANLVWLELFALLPALVFLPHAEALWLRYAVGLAVSTLWCAVVFHFAHRALFRSERGDRFMQDILLLAPPAAVRAHDRLGRRLFLDRHPLAVARVLCKKRELEAFALVTLLDARHPIAPAGSSIEDDFRARTLRAIEKSIEKAGFELDVLAKPPVKIDPSSVAYCPRCRAEFKIASASCETCGGRALSAF